MSRTNIVIFKLPELFKILNEIKKYISINFELVEDLEGIKKLLNNNFHNPIIITDLKNELKNEKHQIIINKFPTTINFLVEKINILSLKNKYYEQSEILINNYTLDLNSRLIKSGMSFKEFVSKSWVLPDEYYGNRYSCMVHGIGLCDEWPQIRYPTDGGEQGGSFEKNMTITLESYIGIVGGIEGVKLEQQYLIGENGLELMSHHPLENI